MSRFASCLRLGRPFAGEPSFAMVGIHFQTMLLRTHERGMIVIFDRLHRSCCSGFAVVASKQNVLAAWKRLMSLDLIAGDRLAISLQ